MGQGPKNLFWEIPFRGIRTGPPEKSSPGESLFGGLELGVRVGGDLYKRKILGRDVRFVPPQLTPMSCLTFQIVGLLHFHFTVYSL